ncbi:MAG: ribonuclease HIII [Verrucomicrobiota bacterium]|jgi:ribonuclease HIII|nr:ribonuclease HIII [Verrucomicrobiota bacterium]MDP7047830.1 ribonuclease HIII [Verrucomicrobiota bacterium]
MTSHTAKLSPEQAETLRGILAKRDFEQADVPHSVFSYKRPGLTVTWYKSGKLLVQGKGTKEFVEFTLEPEVLGEAAFADMLDAQPQQLEPHIGVDESGKGDFFGPLVVAGVYVNEPVARALDEQGVKDSKAITSDKKIAALAKGIRDTPGCVYSIVPIGNASYNRLHQKMRNVNKILAWGHARAIENLLGQRHRMEPPPLRAISDQFARSKSTIQSALMEEGRQLELVQMHKAESDIAVAAASILAREVFLQRLKKLEEEFDLDLPKGASSKVDAAGSEFLKKHGMEKLGQAAKLHFRTTQKIQPQLGLGKG